MQSGYIILGGLRASAVFCGSDFRDHYESSRDSARDEGLGDVKVVTYVLQAQHVAYTSSLNLESQYQAFLDASVKQLADTPAFVAALDRVRVAGYFARARSLSNSGQVGDVRYEIRPLVSDPQKLQGPVEATLVRDPATTDGADRGSWKTVHAVLAPPPKRGLLAGPPRAPRQ